MVYSMLFSYIVLYFYIVRLKESKLTHFIVYFAPAGILLTMVYGLQENVGTDYFSYLSWAEGTKVVGPLKSEGEVLFYYLVLFTRMFDSPQLIFLFAAIIQVLFFMLITFEVKKMNYKLYHFFFLYFTLSLIFFNQFNGVRQFIAVNIIIYALLKLKDNKIITYLALVFFASLFHKSALFFLFLVLINSLLRKRIPKKVLITVLTFIFILSFFNFNEYYNMLLLYIPQYANYIGGEYLQRMSLEGIITKIPKLIIVIFCALSIDKDIIDEKSRYLLNLSYIACVVMVASFTSGIIWRFYQYFDFFIIIPVLMYMFDKTKRAPKIIISLILIIMIIIKIFIIPRGEYLYNSVLF